MHAAPLLRAGFPGRHSSAWAWQTTLSSLYGPHDRVNSDILLSKPLLPLSLYLRRHNHSRKICSQPVELTESTPTPIRPQFAYTQAFLSYLRACPQPTLHKLGALKTSSFLTSNVQDIKTES